MGLKTIASRRITVPPNATAVESIYTVPPGRTLHLKRVVVHFPVGTLSELHIKIFNGWIGIAPTDGFLMGDDVKYEIDVDEKYGSQSVVRGMFINTSTVSQRECIVTLLGELE
jgi:hypothetical protein